jgi:hypothetical protein
MKKRKKEMEKFLVYVEEIEALKELSDEEMGIFFRAMVHFVKTGEIAQLPEKMLFAFRFVAAHIKRDMDKYASVSEKRRNAGKKGGEATRDRRKASQHNAEYEKCDHSPEFSSEQYVYSGDYENSENTVFCSSLEKEASLHEKNEILFKNDSFINADKCETAFRPNPLETESEDSNTSGGESEKDAVCESHSENAVKAEDSDELSGESEVCENNNSLNDTSLEPWEAVLLQMGEKSDCGVKPSGADIFGEKSVHETKSTHVATVDEWSSLFQNSFEKSFGKDLPTGYFAFPRKKSASSDKTSLRRLADLL